MEELDQECSEYIASKLREVADEIESNQAFGTYSGDVDTEQRPGGFIVHGKELDINICTPRFDLDLLLSDEDP